MSAFTRAASATCAAGAVAFTVLAGGMSASAAPVDCAAMGATTVAPGICQIVVTTSGTFSIGAPVGVTVTHLEALLVAGGSAGVQYDGGYGGEVVYVDNLPLTPLTVTIGAGGTTAGSTAGTSTVVAAGATSLAEANPAELEDPADPDSPTYDPSINGVTGVLPSAFVTTANPASILFPAYTGEQYLAGDGVDGDLIEFGEAPFVLGTTWTPAGGGTPGAFANARPSSGSGGSGQVVDFNDGSFVPSGNGAAGVVIFRFAAPEAPAAAAALAATGSDASTATAAAGLLLLGGTAALIAGQRRRARA